MIIKSLIPEIEQKLCRMVYQKINKDHPKSDLTYAAASAMIPIFEGKSASSIQKQLGLSYSNAKKLKNGEKIGRKVTEGKFSPAVLCDIVKFYSRGHF